MPNIFPSQYLCPQKTKRRLTLNNQLYTLHMFTGIFFLLLGESDKCQCYVCGGILHEWVPEDEPESEHKNWFPNCPRYM